MGISMHSQETQGQGSLISPSPLKKEGIEYAMPNGPQCTYLHTENRRRDMSRTALLCTLHAPTADQKSIQFGPKPSFRV